MDNTKKKQSQGGSVSDNNRLAYLLGQSATLNQLRLKITDELIAVQKEIRNLETKGK